MSRVLISVGGTGQHIALAVTRLVCMGALKPDIKLIALDADVETELPKKLAAPTPSLSNERHPLKDGVVKAPFDIVRLGKKNFAQLFVDDDHAAESELFETLFDADEGSIEIHKGMYGTPCVGATVFAEGAQGPLQQLLKPLESASQVFVCGSVVGGTGAGLVHKLVNEIKRYYNREIYGVFLMPWFDIGGGGKGAIDPAIIQRNASHGIKYFYTHTIPQLTASLVLGFPGSIKTAVLNKPRVEDGRMGETASYLHLVAAHALMKLPAAHTANAQIKAYGIAHDDQHEGWLLDETWELPNTTLRALTNALQVRHNLLRFITMPPNQKKIVDHYSAGALGRLTRGRAAWGDLDTSIISCKGDGNVDFVRALLGRLGEVREEDALCVDWLKKLYPEALLDHRPGGSRPKLMVDLAEHERREAESSFHWGKLTEMWSGQAVEQDTNAPLSGADVAQRHAVKLFQRALDEVRK